MQKNTNILNSILLTSFIFLLPLTSFAQEPTQQQYQQQQPPRAIPIDQNTLQPITIDSRYQQQTNQGYSNSQASQASQNAQNMSTCLFGSGLGNVLSSSISSALDFTRVPTGNAVLEGKETGSLVTAGIGWDQVGWCLANSLIESITTDTINWINGGFQGNPVFIDDPAGYFANIADVQAGQFLNELSGGFLCSPIQDIVRVNLAQSYNSQISPYGNQAQCTFTGVSGSLEQFMGGETFGWDDWMSYTQNPYNNPMGSTMFGQIELDRRISQSLGIESTLLDWGAGFFSVKDKETGRISSPGSLIEGQVNQRLFSGQKRLEIADEFNEVMNALVNQIIKTAISEILQ